MLFAHTIGKGVDTAIDDWQSAGNQHSLLVAPGLTTSNKKLLGTKGIPTRSKDRY